jgi:FdhD protein
MSDSTRAVAVTRKTVGGADERADDQVAVEAPLQITIAGEPFAVAMRTPGDDEALVAGFLLAEAVIAGAAAIAAMRSVTTPSGRDEVVVTLADGARVPERGDRRRVNGNAACGLCGRVRVGSIEVVGDPLAVTWSVSADLVATLPARLRRRQEAFDRSGGLHAAALIDLDGRVLTAAEDVGRHNAVDKVVGRMLLDGRLPLHRAMLVVSGRAAYEIVQKAFLAGIPLVAAVSAPSSLAVELASACGITLAGFVRGERFNLYTHASRVEPASLAGLTEPGTPRSPSLPESA